MIDKAESKIEILFFFYDKMDVRLFYFVVAIYETETVTSGLCYIKDLVSLENNIA